MNDLPLLTQRQLSRGELLDLHNHKNTISGFKGERSCFRSPTTQAKRRVGLNLAQNGTRQTAFYGHTQHSTAYSCPIAFQRHRASRNGDIQHLLTSHYNAGGMVLFGSFGMTVKNASAPAFFYDPKETFRRSDAWQEVEQSNGKFKTIHQALSSTAWSKFRNQNPDKASYTGWDLNRRLDAAGKAITYLFTARDLGRLMNRVGVNLKGYVVATEIQVTPSPTLNGSTTSWWGRTKNNVHIHFLLFLEDQSISKKQLRALLEELHARWASEVKAHGFRSTLAGSDLQVVNHTEKDLATLGSYLTKGVSVNADVAGLGASFWDALRDSKSGDVRATQWWRNFEGAVRGRKGMFRISQSLMNRYQVKEARETRKTTWRESNPEPSIVAWFDSTDWWEATSVFPELREQLLLVAEQDGLEGCRRFLTDNGIRFFVNDENRDLKTDAWSQLRSAKSRRAA